MLDAGRSERANELVLEISRTDEDRVAERAPEVPLLSRVAKANEAGAGVVGRDARNGLRAADRDDLYSVQVDAEPLTHGIERDPVGDALHEDHGHAMTLA